MACSLAQIAEARQRFEHQLLRDPNIVGVGSGYKTIAGVLTDQPALVVYVASKVPADRLSDSRLVPPRATVYSPLEGVTLEVSTDVVETGPVAALGFTGRYRPAPGAVSVGRNKGSVGTLGGYFLHRKTGELLLLSNNHVLVGENGGLAGDPIFQQAPLDGGGATEALATLADWVPLDFSLSGSNLVDAAVAKPLDPNWARLAILGVGPGPNAVAAAQIGMSVQKSGRSTERTRGARVTCVDATFRVEYGYGGARQALFRDAIVIFGPPGFCQPGDSGSLLLTDESDPKLVGLLFAANASGSFALANHIQHIFNLLELGLVSAPLEVVRGTPWQGRLAELRALRERIGTFEEGRRLLTLLARHNAEIWCLLREHPEIREEAVQLAITFLETLQGVERPQDARFDRSYLFRLQALLDKIQPLASLPLRKAIAWARGEMWRFESKPVTTMAGTRRWM